MAGLTLLTIAAALCLAGADKESRVIGGSDSSIEARPWQLSLRSGGSHICGASLVAANYAVTAAHCVDTANSYTIGYGNRDKRYVSSVNVAEVIMNPEYDGSGAPYPNDVALLRLSNNLPLGSTVNTIPMATDQVIDWATCEISGWGVDGWLIPGIIPITGNILQYVYIPKIDHTECNNYWSSIEIPYSNVCVMDPNFSSSACSGDSGGPLVCEQNGQKVLVGATSWGSSSCTGQYPSVYTRISFYRDWLLAQML